MEVIVDSSALLASVLGEPEREAIIEATEGCKLLAPAVLPFEIGNALIAMTRRGRLEKERVQSVWRASQRVAVQMIPVEVATAMDLAVEHGIYAYDAYYLQCALKRQRPLVTLDRGMQTVARAVGIRLLLERRE